jgi:alpha/beta superfamily hydrolase
MEAKQLYLEVDGLKLAAELYVPRSVNRPAPALCICHGIPAAPYNPADRGYAILAQKFCSTGFVTLIFNFRGAGRSQGNLDMLGWSRDLQVAIDFLSGLKEADKMRLCLLGFSGGAAVSVYVAAHNRRASVLAACACPADFALLAGKEATSSVIEHFREIEVIRDKDFPPSMEQWVKGFETISPIRWIDGISPRPLLLVHGNADEVIPVEHAHKLYEKAKQPKELIIIPNGKHRLRLEEAAMATVLDWLKTKCESQ